MRFLQRQQYVLGFLAVLVFCCVMVLRQVIANQAAHIQRREDFILLHDRSETKACEWAYQRLIQELPGLNERILVDDLIRTSLLVDPKTPDLDNLVWKYYASVKQELQRRADRRIARALEQAKE